MISFRWSMRMALVVVGLIVLSVAVPSASACDLTHPDCYIHDSIHQTIRDFCLSLWGINRGGLIMAHWVEDMRVWLIDTVLANAFTSLTDPVEYFFYLALILAWLVMIVSFLIGPLIELRWVELRRAMRPILFAFVIFAYGGSFIRWSEDARVMGNSILMDIAQENAQLVSAPSIATADTGDLSTNWESIYKDATNCGSFTVPARTITAITMTDYAARYLWAGASDVHCAGIQDMAQDFRSYYFGGSNGGMWYVADESDGNKRSLAIAYAAQGALRQITGLFMTVAAIIEQIVNLLFSLALALVWFSLLLSLVFAVFLPTEAMFTSQITTLLSVLKASWLASFLIGLGLAMLKLMANSGNALALFFGGLVLIALCVWQGKQALSTVGLASGALGSAAGGAPQAVGGMLKSWGTTAAVVGGVAAAATIGGSRGRSTIRETGGQMLSSMVRKTGRNMGDNAMTNAAGRVFSNRVASKIDDYVADERMQQDIVSNTAEVAWYERGDYDGRGNFAADADAAVQRMAAQKRVQDQQAALRDRKATRARKSGNFRGAAQFRKEAEAIRGIGMEERDLDTGYTGATQPLDTDSVSMVLRQSQLKAIRNRALRDQRFNEAKDAIRELRTMDRQDTAQPSHRTSSLTSPAKRMRQLLPFGKDAQTVRDLDVDIGTVAGRIGELEGELRLNPRGRDREIVENSLIALRPRLSDLQEQRAELRPQSPRVLTKARDKINALDTGKPVAVARTERGLMVNGHSIHTTETLVDGSRVLVTNAGRVTLAPNDGAKVMALPDGQAIRVSATPVPAPARAPDGLDAGELKRHNGESTRVSSSQGQQAQTDAPVSVRSLRPQHNSRQVHQTREIQQQVVPQANMSPLPAPTAREEAVILPVGMPAPTVTSNQVRAAASPTTSTGLATATPVAAITIAPAHAPASVEPSAPVGGPPSTTAPVIPASAPRVAPAPLPVQMQVAAGPKRQLPRPTAQPTSASRPVRDTKQMELPVLPVVQPAAQPTSIQPSPSTARRPWNRKKQGDS